MYSTVHKAHIFSASKFGREELEKSTLQTLFRRSAVSPDDRTRRATSGEAEPTQHFVGSRLKAYPFVAVLAGVSTLAKSFLFGSVGLLGSQLRNLIWNLIILNLRVLTNGSGCARSALDGSCYFAQVFGRWLWRWVFLSIAH